MADSAYQDLLKDTSESKEDGNYFLVTVTDLEPNKTYPIQFRWTFKDKRANDNWSAVKLITTPGESEPNTPKFTSSNVNVDSPEKIIITWDGTSDDAGNPTITNYDRVDVYISGIPFDGTKAAYSFKAPGTATIAAPAGTYQIALYAVSKTGKLSPVSSAVTKTVTAAGVPIQTPTLPSGISVATAPFAVTVNWNGTYSSNTFTGFKSIDIYAVSSDLGSSVTSGITSTNLVGSLTVNNSTNRINIGLDNLRQALGLTSNSDVYNATIFYYYNAVNTLGAQYGSPGSAIYTRINSSSVVPTKANFVDLASGVISIENLVAGNGSFSSWLRAGSAGGARIELSAISDFTNGGNTVQKGLVAYSSGNTELFNLDLDNGSLTINGSGTFTGNLSAGSGNSIFKSDSSGIYLGNATFASAPFSVSRNGIIKAESGTIGGWTLGPTYLQGNNLKLDTTGIVVGSTSSSYLDISSSSITHRNSNGTASGVFTLTLGASPQLSMSGTIALNSSSTIDGTAASTVKSGAASGSTAIQSGNGVSKNASNEINQILLNSSGISIATATSGTRMQLSNSGLELWNGTTQTVGINASTGNAFFKGDITGSSGSFSGTVTVSSGTKTATLNSSAELSLVDTSSTGYGTGGIRIASSQSGYYGNEPVETIIGGNIIQLGRNSNTYQTALYHADELAGVTRGTFLISSGSGVAIALKPNGGTASSTYPVQIEGLLRNPVYSISTGAYNAAADVEVAGAMMTASGALIARRDDSIPIFAHRYAGIGSLSGNTEQIRFIMDTNDRGGIFSSSTGSPSFRAPSDYRLKENIRDFTEAIDVIKSKRLRVFNLKSDPDKTEVVGFIAHEFGIPGDEFVIGEKDAVDEDGNPEYQSIATTNLIPYITGALKEIILRVENIEKRLDALEA